MSYRSFKHLLGETSLERKCRFIFGAGILLLVSGSFFWYGQKTEALVLKQTILTARGQVRPALMNVHYKLLGDTDFGTTIDILWDNLNPVSDPNNFKPRLLKTNEVQGNGKSDLDPFERAALARFVKAAADEAAFTKAGKPAEPLTFANGTPMWEKHFDESKSIKTFKYIEAVLFKPACLLPCHGKGSDEAGMDPAGAVSVDNHVWRVGDDGKQVPVKAGDLAGAVVVTLPMDQTRNDINNNRAMLLTAALVTAILAMFTSLMIVRYVIAKPVKHLRNVADAIAAGRLTVRSQIQTGDEFEELSHAFNRMLHNLVAMQQELRDVNNDLDKKVDELAQANLALYEMNRLKSDFLATMSHELRTPLNSIIGFSEVLATNDQLNERQKRYAGNILTSGKMLLGMINDILDLAKIESGKMEVRSEDFSVRDICEALTSLVRPMADRKNIALSCHLDDAIPLVRQDPGKLRQILYNLLSNAIKFTPDGGHVTLRARVDGRFFVIEVEDTGIGIAEDERETIFEKFRQAKVPGQTGGVLTREHQGTGLGLSIVRELARLLGGDVFLNSQLGQGSTFTVRIPLQLPGNRKFEVDLTDERVDLSKARRIEPRSPLPHLLIGRPTALAGGPSPLAQPPEPLSGRGRS